MRNLHGWIRFVAIGGAGVVLATVAGCGSGSSKGSQVAVKVNKDEVTVQQVNEQLTRLPGVARDQMEPATRRVLTSLVNQQLLVQQAMEHKLDRDPEVLAALDAARRNVLAQAYVQRVITPQAKPTEQEVRDYYVQNPYLFAERKAYRLQELTIEAGPDQAKGVEAAAQKTKGLKALAEYLRANKIPFSADSGVRTAEQLPLARLPQIAQMPAGAVTVFQGGGNRLEAVEVLASEPQPVSDKKATPAIEQFLTNRKRDELAAAEVKRLREAAKIEYVGDFSKYASEPVAKAAEPAAAASASAPVAPEAAAKTGASDQDKGVAALR